MSKPPSSMNQHETPSVSSPRQRDNNKTMMPEIDDIEKAAHTITRLIEQLHAKKSTAQEKELSSARLLGLAKGKKECRKIIGRNVNAMPSFISLVRNGTPLAKLNSASILTVLCKDENMRSKLLIGGCIPPLLSLLKSDSVDARRAAAEAIYEVSLCGMDDDDTVGTKIFVTEGVVPSLWDQLKMKKKQDQTVEGYLVGALRNLCGDRDCFWTVTLEDGGVDIILKLLQSSNAASQSNAASLLARLIRTFPFSVSKIVESGAVQVLAQLLGDEINLVVRASVVNALEAITSKSEEAKNVARDLDGIHLLISAVVTSPVDEENERVLQSYGTQALANLCGGMSALIVYLGGLSLSPRLTEPIADILGALAYALRKFQPSSHDDKVTLDLTLTEGVLVKLLKPRDTQLIQERILEAMSSLYGNVDVSQSLNNVDTKRVLVGLTILATGDPRERMITCLSNLCKYEDVWEAIGKREGIQILIPFLGLSSELHQQLSVEFLAILTDKVEESRWAVTSAGGIPPLLQILETGVSHKAKDDAVRVLWNLCCHSEEIRLCVEKAGAIPVLLGLLQNGGAKAQENSANTLLKLIKTADPSVIEQVQALFLGDAPKSKTHLIRVLGHVLASASLEEFVTKGSAANNGLRSLVQRLASSNEKMKENAASVLADLFSSRKDLCGGLGFDENDSPCTKLLSGNTHAVATQLAHAIGSLSNPTKKKIVQKKLSGPEVEVIRPLIKSAKTNPIESAENPMSTLANLLSDPNIAAEALADDVVSALTRILREGTVQGKRNASQALHHLLKHFQVNDVFKGNDQCLPELIELLNATDLNNSAFIDVLEVLSLLAKAKYGANFSHNPFSAFTEAPSSLDSLVRCVADGHPLVQDKAIDILSRFCKTQFVALGEVLVTRSKSISSLANRTTNSSSPEIKVGGALLLLCAAKKDKTLCVEVIGRSGHSKSLVSSLLDMSKQNSLCCSYRVEIQRPRSFIANNLCLKMGDSDMVDPVTVLGSTISMWFLSIFCSSHPNNTLTVMEDNGLEIIAEKLQRYKFNTQEEVSDSEEKWILLSFLAVMSQEPDVVSSPAVSNLVPTLAVFMQSDQTIDGYFTAQILAALVRSRNDKIIAEIMNSDIVEALINSVGNTESETWNLYALAEELSLLQKPCEATLEALFKDERLRRGSLTQKSIPLLVNLVKPNANKQTLPVVVRLLSNIAEWGDSSKLLIAEAGGLIALAEYLSSSPQDSTELTVCELLGSLFQCPEITHHKTALSSMKQLIGILHLACGSTRYSAARALRELFSSEHIRDSESAWKALSPLVEMLRTTLESERDIALTALAKLTIAKCPRPDIFNCIEGNPLDNIYKILHSESSSLESKTSAARICAFLFTSEHLRESSSAADCMVPIISLIRSGTSTAVEAGMVAVNRLLDSKRYTEAAEEHDCVNLFFGFVASGNYVISEGAISCLVKMAKDNTPRKMDLIKMGIIEQCVGQLSTHSPSSLCSVIAELFRVLTNVGAVARSQEAIKMVQPVLLVLRRKDLDFQGHLGGLQAVANILEKPMLLESINMASSAIITPLIPLLESESITVQHAAAELLTSLLESQRFQEEIATKDLIVPLVKLAGIRVRNLQETALMGLEKSSITWTKEVADAEGIQELSKVIIDEDPQLPVSLWESAAFILSNILRFNPEHYYFTVPVSVLAKMLFSTAESTVILAIDALIIHEKKDSSSVVEMSESGALDALLDLLRSHHCQELSARLVELILRNPKVRETKLCKLVITPLSEYILDIETRSESAKLLVAMALRDISQHEGIAKATDSALACRALISLIVEEPSEEMQMVVMCGLGNFAMYSRTSRKAMAEAGGVGLVQEMLRSSNPQVSTQAALMIRSLFSNHTLQEYVSCEIIKSLTAAMERELWTTAMINVEVVRTLNAVLTTFPKLRSSEAATACIPHLIGALKSGDKEARDSALDTIHTLRQSWRTMPTETARSQAVLAAEAIPMLQLMMKSKSPERSFHERGNSLLNCLPGSLTVAIKRGDNLKRSMGNTNAFCSLIIDNCPKKKTKVVKRTSSPVWKESFTWDFAVPPRGLFLEIVCKSNNIFRDKNLGKVRIPIDKVLTEGSYSGSFSLSNESKKDDGSNRSLDVEIVWSNQTF
ncbi:protein CELLULOSE SYNTHASE INTERACTIVE 2-like [Brassica napus]|uniref:protein CELLULOSE SYNTHASE INTERACTIVE 2 n=1 Tax=Brassica napus TaxID=3708 RepID=UPI0020789A70|nr:protein CELLULOSE SYNTHASE INTERACTIVE 2 [Brassica napus]XP_048635401.1 protein CELLULOSE SYNTHASE INTERACTIVE 2-like [Brassica napus]